MMHIHLFVEPFITSEVLYRLNYFFPTRFIHKIQSYSTASTDSTILISAIFFSGIQVAIIQARIEITVASKNKFPGDYTTISNNLKVK